MKWLIDIEGVNLDATVGLKLLFLQVFGLTVMHNNHKGSHLSIGFSFLSLETSITFSIWKWSLFIRRFIDGK